MTERKASSYYDFFEDCKLEDIAQITGENLNTVKARLYRALRKLRPEAEQNIERSVGGYENTGRS